MLPMPTTNVATEGLPASVWVATCLSVLLARAETFARPSNRARSWSGGQDRARCAPARGPAHHPYFYGELERQKSTIWNEKGVSMRRSRRVAGLVGRRHDTVVFFRGTGVGRRGTAAARARSARTATALALGDKTWRAFRVAPGAESVCVELGVCAAGDFFTFRILRHGFDAHRSMSGTRRRAIRDEVVVVVRVRDPLCRAGEGGFEVAHILRHDRVGRETRAVWLDGHGEDLVLAVLDSALHFVSRHPARQIRSTDEDDERADAQRTPRRCEPRVKLLQCVHDGAIQVARYVLGLVIP